MHPDELSNSISRYEGFASMDPDNISLRATLGDLYLRANRLDEAARCYESCLSISPTHAVVRSRLASVWLSQERYAEAEEMLRPLVEEAADPVLMHNLGVALFRQRRWEEARGHFAGACERGLNIPVNWAYLARTLHHLGHMDEAVAAARRWAILARNNESRSYLALLLADNEDAMAGRAIALEVLKDDPRNAVANLVAGTTCIELQQIKEARGHLEAATAQEPGNGRAWWSLGLVHMCAQEHGKAIAALENAVRIYPDNAGSIVTLGWAKLAGQDFQGAEEAFEHALRVSRSFGEAHGGLAAALALQGKTERSAREIEIARRLDRTSFGAEFAQSALLAATGKQQEATDLFSSILTRSLKEGMPPLIAYLHENLAQTGIKLPHIGAQANAEHPTTMAPESSDAKSPARKARSSGTKSAKGQGKSKKLKRK